MRFGFAIEALLGIDNRQHSNGQEYDPRNDRGEPEAYGIMDLHPVSRHVQRAQLLVTAMSHSLVNYRVSGPTDFLLNSIV